MVQLKASCEPRKGLKAQLYVSDPTNSNSRKSQDQANWFIDQPKGVAAWHN